MSSQEAVIYSIMDLSTMLNTIWKGKPVVIKWAILGDKRSKMANSLYWMWLGIMAESFTKRLKEDYGKDDMHFLMRSRFLGTEDIVVGNTVEKNQLKSTRGMESTPFCEYMTKVELWSIEQGIILPHPPANEYTDYWQAQH